MTELVIRGGTVIDGTGRAAQRADVRIRDGLVVEVADGLRGDVVLDASGCVVAPGFLDLHTHYDPQVLWDPWLTPSSYQGVTGVVAGNCGFSIAPCRPASRGSLLRTLDKVEDMRVATLEAGVDWSFETYRDYLARVGRAGTAVNFAGYIGHTPLRMWAMGDAAWEREATAAELDLMRAEIRDALAAGAVGFSTDRSPFHRGDGGRVVPSGAASRGRGADDRVRRGAPRHRALRARRELPLALRLPAASGAATDVVGDPRVPPRCAVEGLLGRQDRRSPRGPRTRR
jgi:N-acyl-D-aspartate/D-glutamate deacylase